MRSHGAPAIDAYRWRSDPRGVFYEALRDNRSLRPVFGAAIVVIVISAVLAISQFVVLVMVVGLALIVLAVHVAGTIKRWWAVGGPSVRRWDNASVTTRYVHSAGEVTRADSDGDEWVQWVVLRVLPREPRNDEQVVEPYLRRKSQESGTMLYPEEVRIRGGAASACKAERVEKKTVIQASSADGSITVICVPPAGEIYRLNDVPFFLQAFDGVRNMFS